MISTIQKDIEKESNLLKMHREFLVGGKETWKINENGLGVAYRTGRLGYDGFTRYSDRV